MKFTAILKDGKRAHVRAIYFNINKGFEDKIRSLDIYEDWERGTARNIPIEDVTLEEIK